MNTGNLAQRKKTAKAEPAKVEPHPSEKLPICEDMNDAAIPYPQPDANCRRDGNSLTQKKAIQKDDDPIAAMPLCIDVADPAPNMNCRKEDSLA